MRGEKTRSVRALAVTLAVFALLLGMALYLLQGIGNVSQEQQVEQVRKAVRSALITCYAVEGRYPSDVQWLKDNYGLAYDEDRYIVSYDAFASNILPDVRVSVKGVSGL